MNGVDPVMETETEANAEIDVETTEENSACPQADGMSLREMWVDLEDGGQMSDRLRFSQRHTVQPSHQDHRRKSNGYDENHNKSGGMLFGLFGRK